MRPDLWKALLFFLCGGGGGGMASVLLEVLPSPAPGFMPGMLYVAAWTAGVGGGVALGLLGGQHRYLRRPLFSGRDLRRVLPWAVGAGALAGGVAQGAYVLLASPPTPGEPFQWFVEGWRVFCWGLLGLLLGRLLAEAVPNLRRLYGALGGFAGGLLGGVGFVLSSFVMPSGGTRIVGATILGAGIGLALTVAERADLARERRALREGARGGEKGARGGEGARPRPLRPTGLVIHHTPRERALVKLGPAPVTFGTSPDATVYLKPQGGLKPLSATVSLRGGDVVLENHLTGGTRSLAVGDTAQIGPLRVEVV